MESADVCARRQSQPRPACHAPPALLPHAPQDGARRGGPDEPEQRVWRALTVPAGCTATAPQQLPHDNCTATAQHVGAPAAAAAPPAPDDVPTCEQRCTLQPGEDPGPATTAQPQLQHDSSTTTEPTISVAELDSWAPENDMWVLARRADLTTRQAYHQAHRAAFAGSGNGNRNAATRDAARAAHALTAICACGALVSVAVLRDSRTCSGCGARWRPGEHMKSQRKMIDALAAGERLLIAYPAAPYEKYLVRGRRAIRATIAEARARVESIAAAPHGAGPPPPPQPPGAM